MQRIARPRTGIVAVVGWPQAAGAVVYNAASVLRDGAIEQTYRKRELPNYAVFDERRYFDVDPDGDDCVFEVDGARSGLVICEDLWFPEPLAQTVAAGAQLVLVPERFAVRTRQARAARRAAGASACASPAWRWPISTSSAGRTRWCSTALRCVADGDGTVHPAAAAFDGPVAGRGFRCATRASSRRCSGRTRATRAAMRWPGARSCAAPATTAARTASRKVWLGLSGGIDSALVLALAVDALGAENVTAVRMPSRYTADMSNDLAAEQCARAGREAGDGADREAVHRASSMRSRRLFAGKPADVAEENLQSRSRGVILMALSNKLGGLLLTTGNKSEYAVGYATIYGDMCGGYAPIKDLYKTEVFALARWRNAVAATAMVIPHGGDRPPAVGGAAREPEGPGFAAAVRRARRDPVCATSTSSSRATRSSPRVSMRATVDRVLRLVRISEWKRHQAAPGPKVSRRAFGRERRYPITNGYRAEAAATRRPHGAACGDASGPCGASVVVLRTPTSRPRTG